MRDYQVKWTEPIGRVKPIIQPKIAGQRRRIYIRTFHQTPMKTKIFTEEDEEGIEDFVAEWEQGIMKEVLKKEDPFAVRDSFPSM